MINGKVAVFILVILLLAYGIHVLLKMKIDPRRSFGWFLLYVAAHLLTVFVLVFIFSFFLNTYKEFFFKR